MHNGRFAPKRVQERLARVPPTQFVWYIMDEVDSMSIIRHLEEETVLPQAWLLATVSTVVIDGPYMFCLCLSVLTVMSALIRDGRSPPPSPVASNVIFLDGQLVRLGSLRTTLSG